MDWQIARVTTQARIIIPSRLEARYRIQEGSRIAFIEEGDRLFLQPLTRSFIHRLRGSLKGHPSPLKLLLGDRRHQQDR
jgi:bifunctional DNA-binding transcriptional regulator/antitoxin component of YhaV-PrlF toxin-antitoxin module